jgi:threonine dehydratase
MIAGIGTFVKQIRPEVRVIGVQTADSNSMELSLKAGKPVFVSDVGLFADGTAVKVGPFATR